MAWPSTVSSGFAPDYTDWNAIVSALSVWGGASNGNSQNLANVNVLGCVECDVTTAAADAQAVYISTPVRSTAGVQLGPRLRVSCNSYDSSNHVRDFLIRPRTTSNAGAGILEILTQIDGGGYVVAWSVTDAGVTSAAALSWTAPTLTNSWVNYGAPYSPAGYLIDSQGFVHLRGLIKSGTNGAAAFTLPSGFRPANQMFFPAVATGTFGYVEITAAGAVNVNDGGSNTYFTLEGITFATF